MEFTLLFIYFITVNKYRFCISVIGYINMQIIGIGNKKIYIGRSLIISKKHPVQIYVRSTCASHTAICHTTSKRRLIFESHEEYFFIKWTGCGCATNGNKSRAWLNYCGKRLVMDCWGKHIYEPCEMENCLLRIPCSAGNSALLSWPAKCHFWQ